MCAIELVPDLWSGGSRGEEGDVEAGADDEGPAEEHPEGGEFVEDEEGDEGAGDELGVVILRNVGGRGVAESDEEADASGGTAGTGGEERQEQSGRDGLGMPRHAGEAGDGQHDSGKDGEAFGGFSLGENAGPDHVDGEAGDADETSGVADPIALAGRAEGIDGDHDSEKADGDGEGFAQAWVLVEEDGREDGDDRGGQEDEDVEEGERNVAECDNDAEVVGEVEAGTGELAAGLRWPEGGEFAARKGIGGEEEGDEEAEKSDDFVGGKERAADVFDDAVGEDPAGESANGEQDGGEVGGAGGCLASEELGLGIGGQGAGPEVGVRSG
jgi:hypothetical protein